ncbi:MAG TPA: tyrosine--tRNA ligase, partial [Candidatus Sulfomarinibacteraceae bacterium]|nr:tyrosine--tRNA ligase [Candidatus Sulfomarinibacteraceae bacterium]
MSDNIYEELQWRGLIYDETEGLRDLLSGEQKITLYNGFDPTSDSLHVGNLVPLLQLARFQRFGHTPIAIAGGGTGMIGDPSGKSEERNLLSREELAANVEGIKKQLAAFLDFDVSGNPALLVNNADWLAGITMMDFLRDVGKHFTVGY